jgi:glutathione peroxidase-family protein
MRVNLKLVISDKSRQKMKIKQKIDFNLIETVSEYLQLYDKSHPEYKNQIVSWNFYCFCIMNRIKCGKML